MLWLVVLILVAYLVTLWPNLSWRLQLARWFGCLLASYAVLANDSIQTLGVFITANMHRATWWAMWMFIAVVFVGTTIYSWVYYGNISHNRLSVEGLCENPEHIGFLQLLSPIALIVLTHLRMPVSTTFLLLSTFTTNTQTLQTILEKSCLGYVLALPTAFLVWYVGITLMGPQNGITPGPFWTVLQWLSSGLLWALWLGQDGANIAVILPREQDLSVLLGFIGIITLGLGGLFYTKGSKLQELVEEKSGTTDIREATWVNLVYIAILMYMHTKDTIPISTTWAFIGLLGGRELAKAVAETPAKHTKPLFKSLFLIARDLFYVCMGLLVSIILAYCANPNFKAY